MSMTVGLWIDQTRAVIAFGEGKRRGLKLINSNIKERLNEAGVSMPAEEIRQRELTGQLDHYYDEVVSCVRKAESILMFGPVEAKGELRQRLEKNNYWGLFAAI